MHTRYRYWRKRGYQAHLAWEFAKAEEWSKSRNIKYTWEDDPCGLDHRDYDMECCTRAQKKSRWFGVRDSHNHEVLYVSAKDPTGFRDSLGGIVDPDRDCARECEASMAHAMLQHWEHTQAATWEAFDKIA